MTETKPHGIEKFISSLMKETQPLVEAIINDKKDFKSMEEVIKNVILDKPAATRYMGLTPSPKEEALIKILFGYSEIDNAFQVLKDIPFYLRRFPSRHPSISKSRFLNYHIGNYMNEYYILRERLVKYQKVITRMYKKDHRLTEMGKHIKALEILVSRFNRIVTMRGKHVHEERYDDEDFKRLKLFELMIKEENDDRLTSVLVRYYPFVLSEYRKKWIKIISDNNDKVTEILDLYFEVLYDVVFDQNENWRNPNR